MTSKRQFGVSTRLYHHQRLAREHLLDIAAQGFTAVEVFATPTHFDYHSPSAVADLQQWLAEAGLTLDAIHAPVAESFLAERGGAPLTLASVDQAARERALVEAEAALFVARRVAARVLVVHLGLPRSQQPQPGASNRDAARRSVDALAAAAQPLGVQVALEVIANDLSRPGSLVDLIEEEIEAPGVGICLDFGHAHLNGADLVDGIETASGHLVAAHLHDNRGRQDDHLVPFEGTIDWPGALTAIQKVGYDGPLMFEIAGAGAPRELLQKTRRARARMEQLLQA